MEAAEVIIIGAGASGLAAALHLAETGRRVIVLEARNRTGGRIHTLPATLFGTTAEAGAEFIHGRLPQTFRLLKKAGLKTITIEGSMVDLRKEDKTTVALLTSNYKLLADYLKDLKDDVPVEVFLTTHFPGEKNAAFRKSILGFVEGYDAADPARASTLAFRDEWLTEDDDEQYRIEGGYSRLISWMTDSLEKAGGKIMLSTVVKNINWEKGKVELVCLEGNRYFSKQVIVTLPVGVLTGPEPAAGAISFTPPLPLHLQAFRSLGFGAVIKVLFLSSDRFWLEENVAKRTGKSLEDAGFIFSNAPIPTWWTQLPYDTPLLCGWLAGPKAFELKETSDETIQEMAIDSLSVIFDVPKEYICQKLVNIMVFNWTNDPYTNGAYTYATPGSAKQIEFLQKPVDDTIFFAGEALYTEKSTGTVEAAIASGLQTAKSVLAHAFKP
jgi:monoamine oxidase